MPGPLADAGAEPVEASCRVPDQGFGSYGPWQSLSVGRLLAPRPLPEGPVTLLVHFHGAEAARKLLAPAELGIVLVGIDAGEGSAAYEEAFYGDGMLEALLDGVLRALRAEGAREPALGPLVVSSWSAGYGAVRQLLLHASARPAAVVLLDSLHASYVGSSERLEPTSLEPFVELARRAYEGEPRLWLLHSEIRPPSFASTGQTAAYLLDAVGGQRRYAGLTPVEGVEHKTRYDHEGLHVWGFTGTDREAHCAQLRLLLPVLRDQVLPALRSASGSPAPAPSGSAP